jgi:hypothetical protein
MAEDLAPWAAMLVDSQAARFIDGPKALHGAWRNLAMMTGPGASPASVFSRLSKKAGADGSAEQGHGNPRGWPGTEIGWALDPFRMGPRIPRSSRCTMLGLGLRSARLERSRPPDQAKQSCFDFSGKASWVRLGGPLSMNAPLGERPDQKHGQTGQKWREQRQFPACVNAASYAAPRWGFAVVSAPPREEAGPAGS